MTDHAVVSREEWIEARKAFLAKEKEFTRLRDQLSANRRELPWVKVDKEYVFETTDGRRTLAELFDGKSQLFVYHFMFGEDWEEGCPSCSWWADQYSPMEIHLKHRDVSLVVVSKGPIDKLDGYKKRMGWTFPWVSSAGNEFNRDYHVSFTQEEIDASEVYYNYGKGAFPATEGPGVSVFYKDDAGDIFHTYSTYARGLDMLNAAYHMLDMVPKGRDEEGLPWGMAWLRRRDQYED